MSERRRLRVICSGPPGMDDEGTLPSPSSGVTSFAFPRDVFGLGSESERGESLSEPTRRLWLLEEPLPSGGLVSLRFSVAPGDTLLRACLAASEEEGSIAESWCKKECASDD